MKRYFLYLLLLIVILPAYNTTFGQKTQFLDNSKISHIETPSAELENVKFISQRISVIQDVKIGAVSQGQVADLIWKFDEEYARGLFAISLAKLAVEEKDSTKEISLKYGAYRKVISLIAKHDANWTKQLVKAFSEESKKRAVTNLEIANSLIDSDEKLASDFAEQSLNTEITDGLLWFLKDLRQKNQNEANRLFLQILNCYPQQANIDANQFATLGTYLFTSPNSDPLDYHSITLTRVGNIIFPNLSANLPNTSTGLIQAYIENAVSVINRPTNDNNQREIKYALGYLLLPKAQEFAPNLVGELSGAMASLASSVSSGFTSEEAYKNIKKKITGTPAERIEEIEKMADSYARDQLLLDVAFHAWKKNDFPIAKLAASKIDNKDVQKQLENLIKFGEINNLLKDKQTNLFNAMQMTEKLPSSLEKSLLWLAIAAAAEKTKQPTIRTDALDSALFSAKRLDDENAPFLLTYISGQTAKNTASQSSAILTEAIKTFNKFENIKNPTLEHKITLEPLNLAFSLSVKDLNLDFQSSFQKAVNGDEQNGIQIINDLKDERLKGQAYVALAKSIIAKVKLTPVIKPAAGLMNIQEKIVKVGEDGIRKSAAKAVMPVYPEESRKKQAKGVAVAEVQYNGEGNITDVKILESPDSATGKAVVDAMKQWKFKPSKLKEEPVSIRGKITFYFVIDEKGKGTIQNPKQFQ